MQAEVQLFAQLRPEEEVRWLRHLCFLLMCFAPPTCLPVPGLPDDGKIRQQSARVCTGYMCNVGVLLLPSPKGWQSATVTKCVA